VWCFDNPASKDADMHWYGIISKGELARSEIKEGKVFIPKGLGDTPFPAADVWVHLVHMGGGSGALKDNWSAFFPENVMHYINNDILGILK